MRMMRLVLNLWLILLLSVNSQAQEEWLPIGGLPNEETTSIVQDVNGFMWFGTRLGLLRYDGYKFQMYRNDMKHPHNFSSCDIKSLATDPVGRIYAGAFYGLNIFHTKTQHIDQAHFKPDDFINALCYDKRGRLWVGTYNGVFVQDEGKPGRLIRQISPDLILHFFPSGESMYVVTQNNGIYTVDNANHCRCLPRTKDIMARSVCTDHNGTLWIGTEKHGLYYLQNGTLNHLTGADNYSINDILFTTERNVAGGQTIFLATERGILSGDLRNGRLSNLALSLKGMIVKQLYKDRDGNLWASTENNGIFFLQNHNQRFRVEQRAFTHLTPTIISQFDICHLNDTTLWSTMPNINCIHEDARGTTYVGTWDDGLYVLNNGQLTQHLNKSNTPWLRNNGIYALATLADGRLLMATWVGLYTLQADKNTGAPIDRIGNTQIDELHTLSIARFGQKDIWLGVVGGIVHIQLNGTDWRRASLTLYTHVGKSGTQHPRNTTALNSMQDEQQTYRLGGIYRIVQDQYGRIWACTSEPGLLLYNKEKDSFESVSEQMGIPGDNVHSMDIDKQGCFWMTTNYGILRMRVDRDGTVTDSRLYTKEDGLLRNYFGSTMSSRLQDGSLCFINQDGIILTQPLSAKRMQKGGEALIADVQVNNQPLTDFLDSTALLPPYSAPITLRHDENNLTISFSALSYGEEASVRYFYRLVGMDKQYLQTEMGSNSITYTHLPPGTYQLQYGVVNQSQCGIGDVQQLTITILQPLWWRWWAKLVYLMLAVLVVYIIVHTIIDRNRKRHKIELLAVEKRSVDEQYHKMSQFYVKVIRAFLTPVTLMNEQIHELQQKVRPSLQSNLFILSAQAKQLQDSLSNIIEVKDDASIREAMQKATEMTQADRDFLRRCTESVNCHLSDADYSHNVLISEVGASHATLYRKLKILTDMDATSFIRSIRMKAAYQILMQNPSIRISELAERVGYNNPKYFSTCFKAEFGKSPREFQSTQLQ